MNKFLEQLIEQLSQPISVFFFVAYALSLCMFHIKRRRRMLGTKFISDANYATYYFLMGATPGALGAIIAGTGGLIQALTPDRLMTKTRFYRLSAAIILACTGIYFTAQKTDDILPLLAVILGRLAEMSKTPQRIRIGMCLTFPPWVIYNINHEFYLLLFANLTVLLSLVWAVWKHHRIKIIPEPV